MADTEQTVDWRRLREFADVDLENSFVLSWQFEAGTLSIDVDLCLTSSHPFYEQPRPNERACIRPATIEFPYCNAFSRAGGMNGQESSELAAGLGQGVIRDFRVLADGRYQLSGAFGDVHINAERPILRLASP